MKGDFKELKTWQKSVELSEAAYSVAKQLPAEERFALGDQLRRCAVSIPSNIAEGYGRQTDKEFLHFLHISKGSLFELETQIILASRMYTIDDSILRSTYALIHDTGKILNGLINYVRNRSESNYNMFTEPEIPYDL